MSVLTEYEMEALIMARASATPGGFTEQDARVVVEWAERVRIDAFLLEGVLAGDLTVRLDPALGEMAFRVTEQGRAKATPFSERLLMVDPALYAYDAEEPTPEFRKNYDVKCLVCGELPTVGDTELCGPCCWFDHTTYGGNW